MTDEFSALPIHVTENGAAFNDYCDPNGEVRDVERVHYFNRFLDAVGRAMTDGIDVAGYFAWSFLDNLE